MKRRVTWRWQPPHQTRMSRECSRTAHGKPGHAEHGNRLRNCSNKPAPLPRLTDQMTPSDEALQLLNTTRMLVTEAKKFR